MRTYTRADLEASIVAWDEALGPHPRERARWARWRRQAADRGILYPPLGTRWDAWDAEHPTPLAIIGQAISDTPDTLRDAIGRSRSWAQVVGIIIHARAAHRATAVLRDRDRAYDGPAGPDEREAVVVLRRVLERIGDS